MGRGGGPEGLGTPPIYTFRATIPEAWEAWEAGRLAGCLLRYQRSRSEPVYIPLEPRFLRPGRLGWLGGWEAERLEEAG